MRFARMILIIIFMIPALLGCQSAGLSLPPDTVPQTDSTNASPENSATQNSTPSLPAKETETMPATPSDEAVAKMVTLVTQHLAQKVGVATDQIVLSDVKPVVWRDAGLGCPKPGIDYIQVETPGFNIFLEAGGKSYNYHTDSSKRFVLCNK